MRLAAQPLLAAAVCALLPCAGMSKPAYDTSFGDGGMVVDDYAPLFNFPNLTLNSARGRTLVFDPDADQFRLFSAVGFKLNAQSHTWLGQTSRFGDGSLDENVGDGGYRVDVWPGPLGSMFMYDAILDTGGEHLVVGYASPDGSTNYGVVCRVSSVGDFVPEFGDAGCRDTGQTLEPDQGNAAEAIVDGGGNLFYVGGTSRLANNSEVATVTKLELPFAALHADYGNLGVAKLAPYNTTSAAVRDLVMQDGKLLVLGDYQSPGGTDRDLFLARLNPDGSLDTSFGLQNTGYRPITVDLGGSNTAFASALLRRSDGTLVVAGSAAIDANASVGIVVMQLDADGKLITPGWGTGDQAFLTLTGVHKESRAVDLVELADGTVVLAAYASDPILGADPALVAFTPDGQGDDDYGTNGSLLLPIDRVDGDATGNDTVVRMIYDAGRDRIVLAGSSTNPDGLGQSPFLLALRLTDTLFGDGFEAN